MPAYRSALIALSLVAACAPPASLAVDSPHIPGSFPDSIVSGSATLHGTLLVPANRGAPVALIIAGSGPTDRDGNSRLLPGKNNSLRYSGTVRAR